MGSGALDLPAAIEVVEEALATSSLTVKLAWRIVRRAAERGRRISSVTLPRVANLAMHAVPIRDALDQLFPVLPPSHYAIATSARDLASAILDALAAGAEGDPHDPETGRVG